MDDYEKAWERRFKANQRRRAIWERIIEHMGGKCCIPHCGYNKIEALELHHIDPLEKEYTISEHLSSFEAILPELNKCALVCANCHREIHAGDHPQLLVAEDDDRMYDPDEGYDFSVD